MTTRDWLKTTEQYLQNVDIPTARLDAELLLAHELHVDRAHLHTHPLQPLQGQSLQRLERMMLRRVAHEPIAYIIGKQEFYGREFIVSPDTLTPRPETETMVEMMLAHLKNEHIAASKESLQIIDVGTGSGCIIITAALELAKIPNLTPRISYIGLDISEPALKIARKNAHKSDAKVRFKAFDITKNSLPKSANQKNQIILANLPYVPDDFRINLAASHEPHFAIFGGKDGLEHYRFLFKMSTTARTILTESMPPQHKKLQSIAERHGFELQEKNDFIQVFATRKK